MRAELLLRPRFVHCGRLTGFTCPDTDEHTLPVTCVSLLRFAQGAGVGSVPGDALLGGHLRQPSPGVHQDLATARERRATTDEANVQHFMKTYSGTLLFKTLIFWNILRRAHAAMLSLQDEAFGPLEASPVHVGQILVPPVPRYTELVVRHAHSCTYTRSQMRCVLLPAPRESAAVCQNTHTQLGRMRMPSAAVGTHSSASVR